VGVRRTSELDEDKRTESLGKRPRGTTKERILVDLFERSTPGLENNAKTIFSVQF
jgi:hypothetical protein